MACYYGAYILLSKVLHLNYGEHEENINNQTTSALIQSDVRKGTFYFIFFFYALDLHLSEVFCGAGD